jgi:plastocyanin
MNRRVLYSLAIVSVFVLILFSCAELQKQVILDQEKKENITVVKVHNYKFEPNNFFTYEGTTILFKIENVTISEHNFTLTDPEGAVIEDVDIPRDKTIEIKVTFSRTGIYNFYCNKPFHSALGMKGQIEVVGR